MAVSSLSITVSVARPLDGTFPFGLRCTYCAVFYLPPDTRTTQWEDPRLSIPNIAGQAVPYSRDYKRKYEYLKTQLRKPVSDRFGVSSVFCLY